TKRTGESAPPKAEPEGDDSEIAAPHFTLVGEHVLVGTVELAEIEVATPAGAIPVDPKHIHVIERADDEEGASVPSFTIELADGSRLSGALGLPVIPIRWGGRVLKVPARHVREYRNSANEPGSDEDEADETDETAVDPTAAGRRDAFLRQLKAALKGVGLDPAMVHGKTDAAKIEAISKLLDKVSGSSMPDDVKSAIMKRFFEKTLGKGGRP
ncbi:MAG: hypothetical protein ACYTFI_11670, partial [Planctomycetota bacterium]